VGFVIANDRDGGKLRDLELKAGQVVHLQLQQDLSVPLEKGDGPRSGQGVTHESSYGVRDPLPPSQAAVPLFKGDNIATSPAKH
jgi:hypothetical protein